MIAMVVTIVFFSIFIFARGSFRRRLQNRQRERKNSFRRSLVMRQEVCSFSSAVGYFILVTSFALYAGRGDL